MESKDVHVFKHERLRIKSSMLSPKVSPKRRAHSEDVDLNIENVGGNNVEEKNPGVGGFDRYGYDRNGFSQVGEEAGPDMQALLRIECNMLVRT